MSNKPTAAQRRRWSKIADLGCLPCRIDGNEGTPATISHAHEHGYRDHDRVYPSCPGHHLATSAIAGMPNRHKTPLSFFNKYGTDAELVNMTRILLGEV